MRPYEERVESGKYPEHLVRVLSRAQLIPKMGRDPCLHALYTLLVSVHSGVPGFLSLLGDVQTIHLLHVLVRQIDLADGIGVRGVQGKFHLHVVVIGILHRRAVTVLTNRRSQHANYHRSQLFVLPSEATHVLHPRLQLLVRRQHPPHHLHVLVAFLLHDVPQQTRELVVLVVPGGEHLEALGHHLLEIVERDVHQSSRTQYLEQLLSQIPRDGFHQSQHSLNRILGAPNLSQMHEDLLHAAAYPFQLGGRQ
ncbi:unnamed protein product [Lasius platythorax]|uniref:Uncharacterized protein n=1 Tax=Lasius platythorax TaxID=488582 RepID=A0AAV2P767_9HYME